MSMLPVCSLLLCLFQGDAMQEEYGCDRSAIRWTLPGDFKAAREKARKENRILIIKGISFGVDKLGARDATCGTW